MPKPTGPTAPCACTRRQAMRSVAGLVATACCCRGALGAGRALRIGSTLDSSGVEAANGSALNLGAQAYFTAFNSAGGLGGTPVELVMKDDRFTPEVAKENALAFDADSSILAILHPLGTRQTAAVMDSVTRMAIVGPNTGTVGLRNKGATNVFWLRANYDQEMHKLVSTAATLGIQRIGLVYPLDPLGQSLLAAFKAATAKFNITPTVVASTPGTTSPQVEPAAREIAKAGPQVVIMGLAGTVPLFVRALRSVSGSSSAVYGLSIGASATNLQLLGTASRGLGFSIVVPSPYSTRHTIVRHYQADMQAIGSTAYSLPSLEGYINARVLAEGLRRAGATPSRESLLAGLGTLDALDLGGIRFDFSRGRREGGGFVDVAAIGENGRIIS